MKKVTIILLTLLLLAIPTGIAAAQEIVPEGDTVNHDVTLFDEDLTVAEGATINGDVVVMRGDVTLNGTINGDLVVLGGKVTYGKGALVNGDCILVGSLNKNCIAVEAPEILNQIPFISQITIPPIPNVNNEMIIPQNRPMHKGNYGVLSGIGSAVAQTFVMALIAFGTASLVPNHLSQVSRVIKRKPIASGVVGFLTAIAVPSVIAIVLLISSVLLLVCIGILGYPVAFALFVGFIAAAALGWVALGTLLGERMVGWLNIKGASLPLTAALGTAALTLALGLLGAIPYVPEEPLQIGMVLVGLGAAALTKFGRWPYPRLAPATPVEDKIEIVIRTLPEEDLK